MAIARPWHHESNQTVPRETVRFAEVFNVSRGTDLFYVATLARAWGSRKPETFAKLERFQVVRSHRLTAVTGLARACRFISRFGGSHG